MQRVVTFIKRLVSICLQSFHYRFVDWTKPASASLVVGTVADLARTKSDLVAENALLRKPLIILCRQVKRPVCAKTDRILLVLLARMVRTWKQVLFIVQEDNAPALASSGISALLEIHIQSSIFQTKDTRRNHGVDQRDGGTKSASSERSESAANSSSWGLASANARSRSTCDTCVGLDRADRTGRPSCTLMLSRSGPATPLPATSFFFRSLLAFFMIELHSRRVIHVGVTRCPTDACTAQQLREATAYGVGPKYLIRDNDGKFGVGFARVAKTSRIEILKTPYYAPRANAMCERFLGSVRRECLDHVLILHEKQLQRVLSASVHSFNRARPHQGIRQQITQLARSSPSRSWVDGIMITAEVLELFHACEEAGG